MTTLFSVALSVAEKVEMPHRGVSTGGSVTTLIDANTSTQDGLFNGGTLFIQSGSQANTYQRITRYLSDGTYTFATVAPAVAADARYTAVSLNINAIIAAVNSALRDIGQTLAEDSSLVVVANQAEYTLPAGVSNVRKVEDMAAAVPSVKYRWDEIGGKLRFSNGFAAAGSSLRLTYRAQHAPVSLAADVISNYVDASWLVSKSALLMMQDLERTSNDKNKWTAPIQRETQNELILRNPSNDLLQAKLAMW